MNLTQTTTTTTTAPKKREGKRRKKSISFFFFFQPSGTRDNHNIGQLKSTFGFGLRAASH
jgi:hypothetical protein